MNIKKSLKTALIKENMKQKDLALMLDVSEQTLSSWLSRDKISSDRIKQISDVFNLKSSEFIAFGE